MYQSYKNLFQHSHTHTSIYLQSQCALCTHTQNGDVVVQHTRFLCNCGRPNCWPTNVTADISHNLFHSFGLPKESESESESDPESECIPKPCSCSFQLQTNSAPNDTINFSFFLFAIWHSNCVLFFFQLYFRRAMFRQFAMNAKSVCESHSVS